FLSLVCRVEVLGCRLPGAEMQQVLQARPAGLAAEFIQTGAYGGAIQPSADSLSVRLRIPPEPPEDFHGQLLGARRIADEPRDEPGGAVVISVKHRLEGGRRIGGRDLLGTFAAGVHNRSMLRGYHL